MNLAKRWPQIVVILMFLGFFGWWLSFQSVVKDQGVSVQWFGATYGLMALTASTIGVVASLQWGGLKSTLGRALAFFALGLLAQEAGQLIYTYYIYGAQIQIPYPSWGDVAYFGSVLCYLTGAWFLTRVTGAKYALKRKSYKVIAVVVPVVILAVSYMVFINGQEFDLTQPLTAALNVGYPLGEAIYISLAVVAYLLSSRLLGGIMKAGILSIIVALVIQYISDFTFLYESSRGTYLAGEFADLFYLIAYFAFALAMVKFVMIHRGLRKKVQASSNAPQAPAAGE